MYVNLYPKGHSGKQNLQIRKDLAGTKLATAINRDGLDCLDDLPRLALRHRPNAVVPVPVVPDRAMATEASTTLADLFRPLRVADPSSAVQASLWRWSSDEFEDGLTHGWQGWFRRWPIDSFFPAPLF